VKAAHKYLPLFVADANEQLQALSGELVRLEKETPERALWDSIFRRVHSLKGSAATLGFTGIVDIAHHAEDLIGRMRAACEQPSRGQIDLLFEATDVLQKDVRRVAADPADAPAAPPELVARLLSAA
jgi:two-component system, chemotaxis family, sensor kinase CheA